jgi:SAM-dependent methyltransferase
LSNGRTYVARGPLQPAVRAKSDDQPRGEPPVFPRIKRMHDALEGSSLSGVISADGAATDQLSRIRMLEAKVEYLLDEVYSLKSMLRWHRPTSEMLTALHQGQLATFNFQWQRLPYHDNFLSNPEWRGRATADLCRRVEREPDWFRGKKVLDCGCGPGRHSWVFGSLGAQVTAFDTSENGIANARKECEGFPDVTIEYRNILEPLPYSRDYDLVWCYGVVHCTGDTFGALRNITRHLRPGGLLYFMVYAEPSRGEFGEYVYYHEVMAMRQALIGASLEERARVLSLVEGDTQALGWFDAVSSQINDLYTVEELFQMLDHLGFEDIRRTTPDERNLNITAVKRAAENP